MTTYAIADGGVAAHAKTLSAGVEDVVTFPARLVRADVAVLVHPASTGPIYICGEATAATVGGAHCRAVWPGYERRLEDVAEVRLISATADIYSVELR